MLEKLRIPNLVSVERDLLRELCLLKAPEMSRVAAAQLQEYSWQNPEHQIIFDALCRIARNDGVFMREQLAAETTRMGFPDIDWNEYFSSSTPERLPYCQDKSQRVTALIRQLKSAAATC
jgi:hypothetical protein